MPGVAGRPACHRGEIEPFERVEGSWVTEEDQVVDGDDCGTRGDDGTDVDGTEEEIKPMASRAEGEDGLFPCNADGGTNCREAARRPGQVGWAREVGGDRIVADKGGKARIGPLNGKLS